MSQLGLNSIKLPLAFVKNTVKFKPRKKLISKAESLNISQSSGKKPDLSNNTVNKGSEFKSDFLTKTSTNTNLPKDLNLENNLLRQTLTLINKLDTVSIWCLIYMYKTLPSLTKRVMINYSKT